MQLGKLVSYFPRRIVNYEHVAGRKKIVSESIEMIKTTADSSKLSETVYQRVTPDGIFPRATRSVYRDSQYGTSSRITKGLDHPGQHGSVIEATDRTYSRTDFNGTNKYGEPIISRYRYRLNPEGTKIAYEDMKFDGAINCKGYHGSRQDFYRDGMHYHYIDNKLFEKGPCEGYFPRPKN